MRKELVKIKILQVVKKIIDKEIKKSLNTFSTSNCGGFFHQPKRPTRNAEKNKE